MTAIMEERPVFENEEWLVTEGGLEHKATGYFIGRESLGQRRDDGLWSWPLHMAEKSWCRMPLFADAFSRAAAMYGLSTGDELARSFRAADGEACFWQQARAEVFQPLPPTPRTLQPQGTITISIKQDSLGKPSEVIGLGGRGERTRFPTGARPSQADPWWQQRPFRRTGTRLVRLLHAALNMR